MVRGAIATVGLAGAVYAADQATAPPSDDLESTIAAQRAATGRLVAPGGTSEHQVESFTGAQMVELAARYGAEMKSAGEHAQNMRVIAYRSRDLIRMTCIDDKLTQIFVILKKAEPRLQSLTTVNPDELVMRQHFTVLQQARARVTELATEMEQCMGDNLAAIPTDRIKEETPADTDNVFDPTRPPIPVRDVDRPPEASPYR
jgi:hypothetical protein